MVGTAWAGRRRSRVESRFASINQPGPSPVLAHIDSSALSGIDAYTVEVQVDVTRGQGIMVVVGLPDTAVRESVERVRSAVKNSNFHFPDYRITVNLAPADTKKAGPAFDLPIALGILAATEQITSPDLDQFAVVGELSLDGGVRPVFGVLPMAIEAKARGKRGMLVPEANVAEAAVVEGLEVHSVASLDQAATVLADPGARSPAERGSGWDLEEPAYQEDFSDVKGQAHVKRALEVAAAGGHNVIMAGPPGSGKTMLARRLPTIMPPLSMGEALEVTKVYSISGKLGRGIALMTTRPFRSPHHSASSAALVGGGAVPRPGEVSLAHHGVLFLDELPEFPSDALEVLRQPLEDGAVTISRAATSVTYPAQLMLVGALNPCPCGYFTDPEKGCSCSPSQIQRYLRRISGPLLDRVDIHIEVPRLKHDELMTPTDGEPSAAVRARVARARERQQARFAETAIFCNAHMQSRHLRELCPLSDDVKALLKAAVESLSLSARAYDRIIKLARTIADLEAADEIAAPHVAEAIQYRTLDRKLWG
jgi:magnesium chelatase family protein